MDDMDINLPDLNKFEVENIVEHYKKIYQPAVHLSSAFIKKTVNSSSTFILTEWSQRNLERGITNKIQRTLLCDTSLKSAIPVNAVDISSCALSSVSKSEKFKAVIQSISEGKTFSKNYLEIWDEEKSLMTFDLASLDIHGVVYNDDILGCLSWSPCETKILYIAEKAAAKTAPFYAQKLKPDGEDDKTLVGEQFIYDDDWGEQMSPKRQAVISICDIKEKKIKILEGLPSNVCPGQIIWDPNGDGIVGVAFHHEPRRLGIVYCTNRVCNIFHLSLSGKYTVLSDLSKSVYSPRFSPNGKYLIWLQRENTGPHFTVSELIKYNWKTKEACVLVETVDVSVQTKNGKEFHGIFASSFPRRCWSSDSKYILFNSVQKYKVNCYAVNVDDGCIWDIGSKCPKESISILDISEDDYIVGSKTCFVEPTALASLHLPSVFTNEKIEWNSLTQSTKDESCIIEQFTVYDLKTKEERCFATYYGPKGTDGKSVPLIINPHGGPHSTVPSAYTPSYHFFSSLGFGVLIVNYRGSIGCGKKFVDALPGNVGTLDVEDCYAALVNALEKFSWIDKEKIFLHGGSHGGFLVTHLSGQYPDTFTSVVARNPVTNIPVLLYTSDIPDWSLEVCGYRYEGISDVLNTAEIWKKMADVSPVKYIRKVKAPTLLLLGKKDLRVPSCQGLLYYNILKELKVPTKTYFYEDNHSLSTVPVEMDNTINSMIWFKRCLKKVTKN